MAKTKYDIDKAYVSSYDEFLFRFDHTHPKSASQLQEIKKYERIFRLRDERYLLLEKEVIWDKF